MSLDDIRNIRLEKLARLQEVFDTAFPITVEQSHTLSEVVADFTKLSKRKGGVKIVGRIRGLRGHGGSTFLDVEEGDAQIQVYVKKNEVGKEMYNTFIENADIGDVFNFTGTLFITKKKEKTLLVRKFRPLAKSIRPLPEKWHGVQDTEERFRRRSLDLLMNPEAQERFRVRRMATRTMRDFLNENDFEEVETPILQPLYGGALALPFTTHYNALDQDFYLRIAPELYLKRLIVGNIPRVFEIGKNFRNEGVDVTHSPEFTSVEGYVSYADLTDLQKLLEAMTIKIVKSVHKKGVFEYDGKKIEIKKPFRSMKFMDAIKRYALLNDVEKMSDAELRKALKELGINPPQGISKGKLLDEVFKKAVRKHLVEPTFITHHPLDISPLAKASEEVPGAAERLQLIVAGLELMNAYVELNDPIEQRARFQAQEAMLASGDAEATRLDEDYLEVMEYGMPPVAGFGVGIDRLIQLLTDTHNIRDVILFPALRQKND